MGDFLKIAPTLLIVSIAGFMIWPYFSTEESNNPTDKPAATPAKEFSSAQLNPAVGRAHARNPFRDFDVARSVMTANLLTKVKDFAAKRNAATKKKATQAAATKLVQAAAAKKAAAKTATGKDNEKEKDVDPLANDPRRNLVLNATYVEGRRGIAMINDRLYERGESIKGVAAEHGPCVLTEIRHDEVLVDCKGKSLVLRYPSASETKSVAQATKKPADAAQPQPAAAPPRPRPSSTRRRK